MRRLPRPLLALAVACVGGAGPGLAAASAPAPGEAGSVVGPELLRPLTLVTPDGARLAEGWAVWQPAWEGARLALEPTSDGLRCRAAGAPHAVGGLAQTVTGIRGAGAYAVAVRARVNDVPEPQSALLVRLTWLQGDRVLHPAGFMVLGPRREGAQAVFFEVVRAPSDADAVRMSLEVKWPRGGEVVWREASLREATAPKPRTVKVGAVHLRPRDSTPERNLGLWCAQVDAAGALGLDIVCLPEALLMVGTPASAVDVAETIPGPATQRLGAAARRNRLWVVAGLTERDGDRLYNTAVLLDRSGQVAGRYRKVHLPREEWMQGFTPGQAYPVFETDFGRVAIQICYDYFFPEAAGSFARGGAEILFAPTWGTTFADQDGRAEGQTLFRARARDTGLFIVPAVYDGESLVVDPLGRVLASSAGRPGVVWAEIDLAAREPLWGVGEWRAVGPRDRMPATYRALLETGWP
jgi:predicted amidohydrolase